MTELLRRAAALVPGDARSDADCSVADVLEYLDHDEWEIALDILGDFDGVAWQTAEYWRLLAAAADEMYLPSGWFRWRERETRHGVIRADLVLGARQAPVRSGLEALWDLGGGDCHFAALWVESLPELPPGGSAIVRLLALVPEAWRKLTPGDVITMHEGRPVTGRATVVERVPPR